MTGSEYETKKMSFELHPWPHSHVARLHYDVFHRQLDERLRDGDAGKFVVENVMASCHGELLQVRALLGHGGEMPVLTVMPLSASVRLLVPSWR